MKPTTTSTIKNSVSSIKPITIEDTISTIEPTIETTIPITYTNNNYNEFNIEKYIKNIDKIEVNYKHKKYYPTKNDTFKIYMNATTTATKCEYQFNGDIDTVCDKLIENSKQYIKNNPNYIMPFKDESSQDKELMTQQLNFEATLYQILGNWKNNTNNINEDFCSLENYSIVFSFNEEEYDSMLAYTTHNTLVIFPKRIQVQATKFNENWEELLYSVMNHQLNIIRQRACKCRIYRAQSYFQIPTKTLTYAAASETKYYNNTSKYNHIFYSEKQSEKLLLTLGLFRDDVTYDDYYNAIYNSDLNSLHSFFNATTEEEINKLYIILYSIDAVNKKNDLFHTYYNKNDLASNNDITTFVGHNYKIDIFKIILKNMIQYTNTHKDFTIKDNLVMFNLIKSLIVKNSYEILDIDSENSNITFNYEDDFIENIYKLDNIYLEFLSNIYRISIEEIKELEKNDINSIIFYINNYCQGKYYLIPENYYHTTENIVEQFPLLKDVLIL